MDTLKFLEFKKSRDFTLDYQASQDDFYCRMDSYKFDNPKGLTFEICTVVNISTPKEVFYAVSSTFYLIQSMYVDEEFLSLCKKLMQSHLKRQADYIHCKTGNAIDTVIFLEESERKISSLFHKT